MAKKLTPFIKWAGGKEKELKYILPRLPEFKRFIEPFVGGGAVYFNIEADSKIINDKSEELIGLYEMVQTQNRVFFEKLDAIHEHWLKLEHIVVSHQSFFIDTYLDYSSDIIERGNYTDMLFEFILTHVTEFNGMLSTSFNISIDHFVKELEINLVRKTTRMKKLELEKGKLSVEDILGNIETAFKSAYYMHFRYLHNHIEDLNIKKPFEMAIYYFIREYCYASMFRYNKQGKFNVPYGGMSYNRKDFSKKIDYMRSEEIQDHFRGTVIYNEDFEVFFDRITYTEDDFIFLDPPYDSDFSDYAGHVFNGNDQQRLAEKLYNLEAKFMIVIKDTPLIRELYFGKGFNIYVFNKKYLVSFQNRNDKKADHLLITNYVLDTEIAE